jgi:hypothetical protein
MSGCTLMITSGLYFMIPATTSLKSKQIINNNLAVCALSLWNRVRWNSYLA